MSDNNQLRSIVERVEHVEEQLRASQEDRKEIYTEAKSNGFDPKIIKKLVAARRKKAEAVREENELLASYAEALGMQSEFGF
jgi:uncharacterized protein (UPF0335 family)